MGFKIVAQMLSPYSSTLWARIIYDTNNYQQANQALVSLAFGLIASATIITVVSAVFKR